MKLELIDLNKYIVDETLGSDMSFPHKELEQLCNRMATGIIPEEVVFWTFTRAKHKPAAFAKRMLKTFLKNNPAVQDRIDYLRGDLACKSALELEFTRDDLVKEMVMHITDPEINTRDFTPLSCALSKLQGWDRDETKVVVESEMKILLQGFVQNATLPHLDQKNLEAIDIHATPLES